VSNTHETANDAWSGGAENHSEGEGDWNDRKRAGTRAFLEWMPVRVASDDLPPKIWRAFSFGDLMDLLMIDTRLAARSKQAGGGGGLGGFGNKGTPAEWNDPARLLLGEAQEGWLKGELSASKRRGTAWRMLGNQVQVEWYFVADHKRRTDRESLDVAFKCASGSAHLVERTSG
jgi:alkaline phosphatase D